MAKESKGVALDTAVAAMDKFNGVVNQARPFLEKLEPYIRAAYPYCVTAKEKGVEAYYVLQPYYDEEVGSIALAIVLLLFGGQFAMTIACWQIFRVSGHRLMAKSLSELRESFQEAFSTLQKDGEAREIFGARDTISASHLLVGLKEISTAKTDEEHLRARRKVLLLMRCIDPTKIWEGTLGLWTGLVAVLATLRSRFIHCISTGANVGKKAVEIMMPIVQPRLHKEFPNHIKWVDFVLRAGGGILGAATSLLLIRVISAFNSALEGGNLLVDTLVVIALRKKWLNEKPTAEQSRFAIGCAAAVGFFWQFRSGFSLPLILKFLLMPVISLEYFLTVLAARPI